MNDIATIDRIVIEVGELHVFKVSINQFFTLIKDWLWYTNTFLPCGSIYDAK